VEKELLCPVPPWDPLLLQRLGEVELSQPLHLLCQVGLEELLSLHSLEAVPFLLKGLVLLLLKDLEAVPHNLHPEEGHPQHHLQVAGAEVQTIL